MKLICITGMPGCGKEEFVKTIEAKGLPVVRMGDVVRAEAQKRGVKFSDETVGGLAHEERLKHGFGIWAQRTLPYLKHDVVVVDGIRCYEELEIFKQKLKGAELVLVAIHSSPETRRKRLAVRGRSDDINSEEEFEKRDLRELKWGMGEVIACADSMIVNEGAVEELQLKAIEFLKGQGLVV